MKKKEHKGHKEPRRAQHFRFTWYNFVFFVILCVLRAPLLHAQDIITEAETSRIIHILASDSLKGRGNGQPGLAKAAEFIGEEFKKAGLSALPGYPGYFFLFSPDKNKQDILYNIVGALPGKSKFEEIVIFSAHYDHLGVFRTRKKKDSILNGANDNASGTTALLMLAKYFAARNDNERTLVFCAFAGEELGLKGSTSFINYIDPEKIVADVNIEMIGIPQYGRKTVFITGADQSSFADIIRKNVDKKELKIIPDPDPDKALYERSDNYPFVRKGVVAHSIMASDDTEKCYHRPCDEVDRIDIPNMTAIIKAIAKATRTLVSGEDKPERE